MEAMLGVAVEHLDVLPDVVTSSQQHLIDQVRTLSEALGEQQAAHHHQPQGLAHVTAGPEAQGQGQGAQDGGSRGHHDRPEPQGTGLADGGLGIGAAQAGLMVYRNYFGERKSARKVQWSAEVIFNVLARHEPDHVLMREARRDALHNFLDAAGAVRYLRSLTERSLPIRLREVDHVPPLSFWMYATKIKEALLVEDPRETLERLYHEWWVKLGGDAEPAT